VGDLKIRAIHPIFFQRAIYQLGVDMQTHDVTVFRPYPFRAGQKIVIDDGPRKGDWEVVAVTDRKVKLRCPFSHREFEWNRFCYVVDEQSGVQWPGEE
jgi:hypothetical protein